MSIDYDVIVVGAGIIGSCIAYHSQKMGMKTLLLEQFHFGHGLGSSVGKSRIIRYAHNEAAYMPPVIDSYQQIAELEKKRNEKLWKRTGLLFLGSLGESKAIADVLKEFKIDHELLIGKQINAKYPQFEYDETWAAVYDPMGGVLFADKWLNAFQDEFRKLGGIALDNQKVISYHYSPQTVVVRTQDKIYFAKKLALAAGTWMQGLVPQLKEISGAQPESIAVTYWRPKRKEDMHYFTQNEFPVSIMFNKEQDVCVYGLPSTDYPDAIKFGFHGGAFYNIGDKIPAHGSASVEKPRQHLQKHIKMIDASEPAYTDNCKYTKSKDENYVIDRHPEAPNVFIAGCMSGLGFKVGPSVGRAMAHMMAGKPTPVDLSFFSLERFRKSKL